MAAFCNSFIERPSYFLFASSDFACIHKGVLVQLSAVLALVRCTLLGYLLFKDFCENVSEEPVPQMSFYDEVSLIVCSICLV